MILSGGWVRGGGKANPWKWPQTGTGVSGWRKPKFILRECFRVDFPHRLTSARQSHNDNRHPGVHIFPQTASLPQNTEFRLTSGELGHLISIPIYPNLHRMRFSGNLQRKTKTDSTFTSQIFQCVIVNNLNHVFIG